MRPVLPFLLLAALANAQPGPQYTDCLDTLVLDSEFVFVGRILEVHPERQADLGTNVVVEVQERFKGIGLSPVTQAEIKAPADALEGWRKNKTPLLILNGGMARAIDLNNLPRLLSPDLKPLTTARAILDETRDTVRHHPGVLKIQTLYRYFGEGVTSVPVDEDLQQWARATLRAKGAVKERSTAAAALSYFLPEKGDVELLKSLLTDDEPTVMRTAEENRGWLVERFLTRVAAYESLTRWDVKLPAPEFERKTFRPELVKYAFFVGIDFTPEAMADVPKFPNLRDLYLQINRLTPTELAWLASLKNVHVLHFELTSLTDADLAQLKGGLPNLETLIVQGTALTDDSIDVLATFPKLKRVGIAGTKITPAAATRLQNLRPDITLERKAI